MSRHFRLSIILIATAVLANSWAEQAVVELKNGQSLRGEVRETPDQVIIVTALGELRFDRTEVLAIKPIEDPPAEKPDAPATKPTEKNTLGDDVAAEFRKQFAELAADDIDGHFKLAEWARDRSRYDLAATQCRYILGMKPDHRNARLLLQLAEEKLQQRKLRESKAESRPAPLVSTKIPSPPLLSDRDIQRLRIGEILSGDGQVERLRVSFNRKAGQRDLIEEVGEELKSNPSVDPADLRVLERGRTPDQLRVILRYTGMKYADRIDIEEDPKVFDMFRTDVLPILYNNCARSGCHGGEAAKVFRLPPRNSGRKDAANYTAFAILDGFQTRKGPLINRRDPTASPLLDCMLPVRAESAHTNVKRFQPVAQSARDRSYETVLEWIRTLKTPRPEYGLERSYIGYCPVMPEKSATSQPTSAESTPPEDSVPEKDEAMDEAENPG